MTDIQLLTIIFSALLSLMTSIILWRIKKSDIKADKRAAIRVQADKLQQEGISVVGSLSYACGRKLQTGDHDKELEVAMKCYDDYKGKKAEFTQQLQAQYTQGTGS